MVRSCGVASAVLATPHPFEDLVDVLPGFCLLDDEQIATFALEQEGTDLERGSESQGFGYRGVETGDHVFHRTPSSSGLLDALLWWGERGFDTSGEGTVFGLDLRTGFTREHPENGRRRMVAIADERRLQRAAIRHGAVLFR
jgi:hypothetical protein